MLLGRKARQTKYRWHPRGTTWYRRHHKYEYDTGYQVPDTTYWAKGFLCSYSQQMSALRAMKPAGLTDLLGILLHLGAGS